MELDKASKDRSYLFGRLLAIAEKVERSTYERDEGREPAAIRLQAAFAAHPFRTWATIEKMLTPYYAKLKPGSRRYYRDRIGEIIAAMPEADAIKLNLPLEDTYLLGYYLQRCELNSGKQNYAENEATDCSNDE